MKIDLYNYKKNINFMDDEENFFKKNKSDDKIKYSREFKCDKNQLHNFIENILKANDGTNFYNITYITSLEKIIFFTDKEIELKNDNGNNINSLDLFLNELKNTINSNNFVEDTVSLYDVVNTLEFFAKKYFSLLDESYKQIEKEISKAILLSDYYKISNIKFINTINSDKELTMCFEILEWNIYLSEYSTKHNDITITFSKNLNGDIYIKEKEIKSDKKDFKNIENNIFLSIYTILVKLFEKQSYFDVMLNQSSLNIKVNNLNCFFNIFKFKLEIMKIIDDKFVLDIIYNPKGTKKIENNSNSSSIISMTKGKEMDIFKKIYVKTENLPKWMKEYLKGILDKKNYENSLIEIEEQPNVSQNIFSKVKSYLIKLK